MLELKVYVVEYLSMLELGLLQVDHRQDMYNKPLAIFCYSCNFFSFWNLKEWVCYCINCSKC
jgi:hypothetical protein